MLKTIPFKNMNNRKTSPADRYRLNTDSAADATELPFTMFKYRLKKAGKTKARRMMRAAHEWTKL